MRFCFRRTTTVLVLCRVSDVVIVDKTKRTMTHMVAVSVTNNKTGLVTLIVQTATVEVSVSSVEVD